LSGIPYPGADRADVSYARPVRLSMKLHSTPETPAGHRASIGRILARGARRLLEHAADSPQVSALSEISLCTPCLPSHAERVSTGFGTPSRGQGA